MQAMARQTAGPRQRSCVWWPRIPTPPVEANEEEPVQERSRSAATYVQKPDHPEAATESGTEWGGGGGRGVEAGGAVVSQVTAGHLAGCTAGSSDPISEQYKPRRDLNLLKTFPAFGSDQNHVI